MTGQQLKNSILQMAVQGKLVPQDPDDEPASVLLERIRKEKERLVREKKIKLEKNPSVIFRGADNLPYEKRGKEVRCIADEVPFEIPDSWEWVRLPHIAESELGKTLDKARNTGDPKPYLCSINVYWTGIELTEVKQAKFEIAEQEKYRLKDGDLLICEGGDVGRCAVWHNSQEMYYQNALHRVRFWGNILPEFFKMVLEAYKGEGLIDEASKGMTIKHFTQTSLYSLYFPLPSIEEQRRILNQMKILSSFLTEYTKKEDELSCLNASLPSILKKSILQEAIQGKLVPQDPNDEPASILLERIRKEKARLVKEGKLKPDKHESIIFRRDNSHYEKRDGKETCIDDEIPFEIPASWEWTRLGTILLKAATGPFGSMLHKSDYVSDGVPLINPANIHDGTISDEGIKNVAPATASKLEAYRLAAGDVIIGRRGELGRSAVVGNEHQYWLCGTGCFFVTPANGFLAEYLVFLLSSSYVRDSLMTASVGTTMNNLNHDILKQLLVPLPPSVEQLRILNQFTTVCSMAAW